MDSLKKLCEALNCSADYLLGQEPLAHSGSINNIYFHLAKEMEEIQLPEFDIEKILNFARYMKKKLKILEYINKMPIERIVFNHFSVVVYCSLIRKIFSFFQIKLWLRSSAWPTITRR